MCKKLIRKPIQIEVCNALNENGQIIQILVALCDDGTIWSKDYNSKHMSNPMPWGFEGHIPQKEV